MSEPDGKGEKPTGLGCGRGCGVAALLFALPVFVYLFFVARERFANYYFERLLKGDSAITIRAIEISRRGELRARIDNPEVLKYLAARLQHAEADKGDLGTCYQAEFCLSNGSRVHAGLYIPARCDQITIALPFGSIELLPQDNFYYAVTLVPPVPKDLDELLFELGEGRPRANPIR
jgi:hypothetical protein